MKKSKFKMAVGLVLLAGIAWFAGVPLFLEFKGSFAMREFKEKGVFGTYRHHFLSFFGQVDELAVLDRENDKLTQKIAHLEKKVVLTEARNAERDLAALNEMVEDRLRDDAGSELAVAQKNIEFEIPKNLSYNQLQVLSLSYFNKKEYGPSALILNHLITLKDETRYRTPENHLLSGISWYHLKHFHLAAAAFKEAKASSHPADAAHRNSMVWLALVQKSLGKKVLSQDSLLKFLELYPHSVEASMINGGRRPAREVHEPSAHAVHDEGEEHSKTGEHHEVASAKEHVVGKGSHGEEAGHEREIKSEHQAETGHHEEGGHHE